MDLRTWCGIAAIGVTLPVAYPVWLAHELASAWGYDRLAAAVVAPDVAAGVVARLRAGEGARATAWVRIEHSLASGSEELPALYVVTMRDGQRAVLAAASGVQDALDAAGIRATQRETHRRGFAVVIGGLCWLTSLAVLAAAVHGGPGLWLAAAVAVGMLAVTLR